MQAAKRLPGSHRKALPSRIAIHGALVAHGTIGILILGITMADATVTSHTSNQIILFVSGVCNPVQNWNFFFADFSQLILVTRLAAVLSRQNGSYRFPAAVDGMQTSILFIYLVLLDSIYTSQATMSTGYNACALLVAVLSLVVFLSVPRLPDESFRGRAVDREQTCSIFERMTFLWAQNIFNPKLISKLDPGNLPALRPELRLSHLLRHPIATTQYSDSLGKVLARKYALPIMLQWSLAAIQSFMTLVPELVTYRLLQWLGGQQEDTKLHGITLAILLGVAKIASIATNSWLKWGTCSRILVPMQSTVNALVYEKALSLPRSNDAAVADSGAETATLMEMRNCW